MNDQFVSGFETSKSFADLAVKKKKKKKIVNLSSFFHVSLVFLLKFFCPILISIETWDSHLY